MKFIYLKLILEKEKKKEKNSRMKKQKKKINRKIYVKVSRNKFHFSNI